MLGTTVIPAVASAAFFRKSRLVWLMVFLISDFFYITYLNNLYSLTPSPSLNIERGALKVIAPNTR
jgi:hypothetical protein